MNIYDIARAADAWGDSILADQERRDELDEWRRQQIRRNAEELAEDLDDLESFRSTGVLIDADIAVRFDDGTIVALDRAHDLLRDAARSHDVIRASHIAVAAHRAIVDELIAKSGLWWRDPEPDHDPEVA